MNSYVDALAWPSERLAEGLEQLARHAGLKPNPAETGSADQNVIRSDTELDRWISWACEKLGLEAEAVESTVANFGQLLLNAGPALFHHRSRTGDRFWLVLKSKSGRLQLIGPDFRLYSRDAEALRKTLCAAYERPVADEIDRLLDSAGIRGRRRKSALTAMLRERMADKQAGGCWMLRMPAGAGFKQQLADSGLLRRLMSVIAVFAAVYGLEIAAWRVIGEGALGGRLDLGWLSLWALLMLSLIPLGLLGQWLESTFALDLGRILKQRLLNGAMKMDIETIRSQGAGQLLGRVIESQALESLALNGGLSASIACIELVFAAWIIANGAGGGLQLSLLCLCLIVTTGLGWRYFSHLRRMTKNRLDMTHDLVERMVGHRTCLAQESSTRREESQDQALDAYLSASKAFDRAAVPLTVMPRAWMITGLMGLAPAFISGSAPPFALAISLGGLLLAGRALSSISNGLSALARAVVAWQQVAPFFHAAGKSPCTTPFLAASPDESNAPGKTLIEANGLMFRYRPQGEPVLRRLDLSIRSGERVLLLGSSGGGKSTLAAILAGLRSPESGLLLLNGLDRHSLGDTWHKLASSAPQFHENHIFTGTLAFNLLMGRRWPCSPADQAEAEELCVELGLADLLGRMPSGLMQMVGETGWQLSHGERSRVFLARALLQNAQLTILDESFAALDPETLERCLSCARKRANTLLVIAHP